MIHTTFAAHLGDLTDRYNIKDISNVGAVSQTEQHTKTEEVASDTAEVIVSETKNENDPREFSNDANDTPSFLPPPPPPPSPSRKSTQKEQKWFEAIDQSSGKTYFYNKETREVSWHRPEMPLEEEEEREEEESKDFNTSSSSVEDILTHSSSLSSPPASISNVEETVADAPDATEEKLEITHTERDSIDLNDVPRQSTDAIRIDDTKFDTEEPPPSATPEVATQVEDDKEEYDGRRSRGNLRSPPTSAEMNAPHAVATKESATDERHIEEHRAETPPSLKLETPSPIPEDVPDFSRPFVETTVTGTRTISWRARSFDDVPFPTSIKEDDLASSSETATTSTQVTFTLPRSALFSTSASYIDEYQGIASLGFVVLLVIVFIHFFKRRKAGSRVDGRSGSKAKSFDAGGTSSSGGGGKSLLGVSDGITKLRQRGGKHRGLVKSNELTSFDSLAMNVFMPDREGLSDLKESLLTDTHVKHIMSALPNHLQATDWSLLYATDIHGYSLQTVFRRARKQPGPTILVVKDENGHIFGGFATHTWKPRPTFFGTGECFLFSLSPKIAIYRWTGANSQFLLARDECVGFGGGGSFGLWLDGCFETGNSARSPTFDNGQLARAEDFRVVAVEIWRMKTFE